MVQIAIIEQHLLLRLGLTSLMTCLTSTESISSEGYDELYQSPPRSVPTELVLLGAQPEERINLLIQAARRAHAPKRIILLSDPPTFPSNWTNLPPLVTHYLSTRSSAETILSTVQTQLQKSSRSASPRTLNHPSGIVSFTPGAALTRPYRAPAEANGGFRFEVDEAKMLGLSARQYEVLLLLAQGHPIKLICRHLDISMATTKGHFEALYQRLGVHNRNEAVFVAMARGAALKMPEASQYKM